MSGKSKKISRKREGGEKRERKLTCKQQTFLKELAVDFNSYRAAIAAGYSEKTAKKAAVWIRDPDQQPRLYPEIQKVLEARNEEARERAAEYELTERNILRELARIAFFDPRRLYHPDGRLKKIFELDDDTAAVIAGMEESTSRRHGAVRKIKFWNKNKALEDAMKHLGLFEKDNNQRRITIDDVLGAMPAEFAERVREELVKLVSEG